MSALRSLVPLGAAFAASFAAASLAAASLAAASLAAQPAPSTRRVQFTVSEGTWMSLDVAPNGRTIAFELLGDLYTLPIDGGTARPILTGSAFASQPRYAPDGTHLAYVSDENGTDNVWIAAADGSAPRRVSDLPRATVLSPAWSADGASLYATVVDNRVAELYRFDVATGAATRVVPNGSGQPSPLVSSPAPGPYSAHATRDGRALYYTSVTPRPYGSRQGATSAIVRRDLATGRDEPVVVEEPAAMTPVVSHDGRLLVYAGQSRGRTGLRVRELASGAERWLAYPTQRNELEARASRDVLPGFAFTPNDDAVIAAFGGRIHRITVATGADSTIGFSATYTADLPEAPRATRRVGVDSNVFARITQQLAVAADGRVAFSALGRIVVQEAGFPRTVTDTPRPREFMPAWSPDGRWVAYVTWDPSGGALYKVRADSRKPTTPVRLSRDSAFWADPVWSRDGKSLYALRAPQGSARTQSGATVPSDAMLVRIGADGGAATPIASAAGLRHPHVTTDPAMLWLSSPAGLVSMTTRGEDRRLRVRLPRGVGGGGGGNADIRISPDGRTVVLSAGERLWQWLTPTDAPGAEPPTLDLATGDPRSADAPSAIAFAPNGALYWTTGMTLHSTLWAGRGSPLSIGLPRARPQGTVVLRGARVITMRGNEVIDDADVVVTNDRIAGIGARGSVPVPNGARIIDVAGKTIVPGIVDVHAHWQIRRELLEPESPSAYANLAFGVTTIRDPQTSPDIFAYADLADAGGAPSPRIFSTGPGLFAESNFQSLDEVRATLRRYRDDYGTTLLKSYLVGNRRQRQWVVHASRELGMLPTTEGGADAKMDLTHALDGFSGNEHALPTAPLYDDVVQLLARSGITYTPTLLVSFGAALPIFRLLAEERPFDDPKLQRFFPADELYQRTATRLLAFPSEDYNDAETSKGAADVLRAGGRVALGGHGEMQGLQVHWEMRLLAEGGMAPHDILRVATLNGAAAIGVDRDLGSLEPGKLADLVVLDRDPLVDIRNTSSVRRVMKNGVLYDGDTLDQLWPAATPLPAPWWRRPSSTPRALDQAAIDRAVREEMERQRIPGVAVAVLDRGRTALAKGYGLANIEQQTPVTPATMFESGSLGKMFTASGVLLLVQDGRLALDSSVRTYLPNAPAAWQPITLRHLLSHTSGIPDYTSDAMDYRRDYTDDQLLALAYSLPLEFAPGTRWNYSNTGYITLGAVITKVTGRPYWEFLRARLFTPAGMQTVRIISEADIVPHRASGYRVGADGAFRHQEWVSPTLNTTADGSLLISLDDLIAWGGVVRARGVLAPSSWEQLLTPIRLNSGRRHPYGFGWFLDSLRGQRVIQHGGSWQGFRTQLTRYEGRDLTVIVLANSDVARPDVIASRVAAAIDSSLAPPPPPSRVIPDRDPAVTALVRAMLLTSARGDLAVSDFEFVRTTIVPRMGAAYRRLLEPLGALESLELLAAGAEADDRTFVYRALYRGPAGDARVLVRAKVGPGGGMTGWQLSRE